MPDALANGAEIRAESMVSRVEVAPDGRARGVVYFQNGVERRQRARLVAVAGYAIETPGCCSTRRAHGSESASATTSTWSGGT
ncbi:MAG: hypothetical protein M3179_05820 [Actinomycetota bacterium]|nr:hypothetical protein [Actinomycetota bacterium]